MIEGLNPPVDSEPYAESLAFVLNQKKKLYEEVVGGYPNPPERMCKFAVRLRVLRTLERVLLDGVSTKKKGGE